MHPRRSDARVRAVFLALPFCVAPLVACGDASQERNERLGAGSQGVSATPSPPGDLPIIRGGGDDADTPEANVVVDLWAKFGANGDPRSSGGCTGTLLTPTAVLTAKHCINGSANGDTLGIPQPIQVTVGGRVQLPSASFFEQDSSPPVTFGGDTQQVPSDDDGTDAAIFFLSRPVLTVHVVRPSLRAPAPQGGDDTSGGVYDGPVGIAGWSPFGNHDPLARQVAWVNSLTHEPGYPYGVGQVWIHDRAREAGDHGDSGGPLFFVRADGTRDVVGVFSGWHDGPLSSDDYWTDVTRGAPRAWLRSVMVDSTRSPHWLAQHGVSEHWRGEVQYWGPCQSDRDADCDYWFDASDNCPRTSNMDQIEGVDGWGVACPGGANQTVWGPIDPGTGSHECVMTCGPGANGQWSCRCGGTKDKTHDDG